GTRMANANGQKKVVFLGQEDDPLTYERAELEGMDVEIARVKPDSEGEAIEAVKDADVVLARGYAMKEQVIKEMRPGSGIIVYSHGFDHMDADAATEHGVMVANGAGMCSEEVSDQACALIMDLARGITFADRAMSEGRWRDPGFLDRRAPLDEATLGIVGFGGIGKAVRRKMAGWRMRVLIYDPWVAPWEAKEHDVEQVHDLHDMLRQADYVTVHVPHNRNTDKMFGEAEFKAMKSSAFFVNTCRGKVVDEAALISALESGEIAGAGLDVFEQEPTPEDNPLRRMPNVITTPHAAGGSTRSAVLSRIRAGQNAASMLRGEWPMAGQNPAVRDNISHPLKTAQFKGYRS
ncbi:MAG: C-terminal binding protein, partial [Chloroflexota bacterium]